MLARLASFFRLSVRELMWLSLAFALSLPAVTLRLYASDEVQYYAYLRSLWFDRDVSFENEYRHFYDTGVARTDGFRETLLERETGTGRRINFATIGSAMLWSPFFAAADVGARIARALGSGVPVDGYSRPYVAAVCLGSAVCGFLAILLSIRLARELTGTGLRAGVIVWLGTPLLFYMYLAPVFAHATSAFAVALFITVWMHVRSGWTPRGVAALAAAGALMTMVREQDACLIIGPVVDFGGALLSSIARSTDGRARTQLIGGSFIFGAIAFMTFVVVFSPQLAAYQALNGGFRPSPLVVRKMLWSSPHALEVLLSPEHGYFVWTPLAILALAGLGWLCMRAGNDRRVPLALLVMFAANVYVAGSVDSWSAAGAFGQRRFVNVTPLLIVGIAALIAYTRAPWPRRLLFATVTVCVWWNLALMAQFGTNLMDRHRLEPRRNAYTAFVTLPKMAPDLAYRYLFDRASFYKTTVEPSR